MKFVPCYKSFTLTFTKGSEPSAEDAKRMIQLLDEEARENRFNIIESAQTIERELESIIAHYFLGASNERRNVFESLILNSDWCTFAAKRKLVTHIINEKQLLEGSEKNAFDELMRNVMSLRNAFTHGKLRAQYGRVWLSYFQGSPRDVELTDDYFTGVERTLTAAYDMACELANKVGVERISGNGNGTV